MMNGMIDGGWSFVWAAFGFTWFTWALYGYSLYRRFQNADAEMEES